MLPSGPRLLHLRQTLLRGDEAVVWRVEYTYENVQHRFDAPTNGSAMDVDAVMAGVDALMERSGRTERVYRLAPGRYNNGEMGMFIAVDSTRFPEVAWRLRLPLLRSPSVSELPPGIPTAAPEPLRVGARPMAPRVRRRRRRARPRGPRRAGGPCHDRQRPDVDARVAVRARAGGPADRASGRPGDAPVDHRPAPLLRRRAALLQGGRWMNKVRAEPPEWMTAGGDPVRIFYDKQEILFRKGRIGWAALVEADDGVFARGGDDLPGVLVYSEDEYFDARPAELAAVAARLLELKSAGAVGAFELSRFAQLVRNDSGRPLGVPVPAALNAKEPLLSSFVAIRAHLPDGLLAADWFPVLMHPSSVVPMIVPSTFWPPALLAAWNERRLSPDASAAPGKPT